MQMSERGIIVLGVILLLLFACVVIAILANEIINTIFDRIEQVGPSWVHQDHYIRVNIPLAQILSRS